MHWCKCYLWWKKIPISHFHCEFQEEKKKKESLRAWYQPSLEKLGIRLRVEKSELKNFRVVGSATGGYRYEGMAWEASLLRYKQPQCSVRLIIDRELKLGREVKTDTNFYLM